MEITIEKIVEFLQYIVHFIVDLQYIIYIGFCFIRNQVKIFFSFISWPNINHFNEFLIQLSIGVLMLF